MKLKLVIGKTGSKVTSTETKLLISNDSKGFYFYNTHNKNTYDRMKNIRIKPLAFTNTDPDQGNFTYIFFRFFQ